MIACLNPAGEAELIEDFTHAHIASKLLARRDLSRSNLDASRAALGFSAAAAQEEAKAHDALMRQPSSRAVLALLELLTAGTGPATGELACAESEMLSSLAHPRKRRPSVIVQFRALYQLGIMYWMRYLRPGWEDILI